MKCFYHNLICSIFIVLPTILHSQVVINEIMSDNEETLSSISGETHDYIELYNDNDYDVNLDGYYLSDNIEELTKWKIIDRVLTPNSFILIYASGLDLSQGNELHTNFKISSDGEEIYLSDSNGQIVDEFDSIELDEDEAYGRLPDGSESKVILPIPSPDSSNNAIDIVILSHSRGYYDSPITLSMTSLIDAEIRYTTDGSVPDINSDLFTSPLFLENKKDEPNIWSEIVTTPDQSLIGNHAWQSPGHKVDKAHTIRCASFVNGELKSHIQTNSYFVDDSIFEKYDMPIISLVTDGDNLFDDEIGIYVPGNDYNLEDPVWTGNYFQTDDISERPVHIEYFQKDGDLGFSQNAGIRIHGGKTRHAAQKSLRLYSRTEYEKKYFDYKLLPQKDIKKYKRFILSTTMGSWGGHTVIKDVLSHEIVRDFDIERQDSRPVVVFINGEYWGIQTIRDRLDENYIEYTTGIDSDSIKIWSWGFMNDSEVKELLEDNPDIDEEEYQFLSEKIDIESFIDYQIAEMYLNNYDWPANNVKYWKSIAPNSKWRYIFYDTDAAFGDHTYNMLDHSTENDPDITWPTGPKFTFLFRALLTNETFLNLFLQKYADALSTTFDVPTVKSVLNNVMVDYEIEMPRHIDRWHYPASMHDWKDVIDSELTEFLENRPCTVVSHIKDFFSLEEFAIDCSGSSSLPGDFIDSLSIYPNPTHADINIHNNSGKTRSGRITILDPIGNLVIDRVDIQIFGESSFRINVEHLASGIYILKYTSVEGDIIKRIIVI